MHRHVHAQIPTEPTTDLFVNTVILRVPCKKHAVSAAHPCWWIPSAVTDGLYYQSICHDRARNAGMMGAISPFSMRVTRTGQRR